MPAELLPVIPTQLREPVCEQQPGQQWRDAEVIGRGHFESSGNDIMIEPFPEAPHIVQNYLR
jgi:hypothetical protein